MSKRRRYRNRGKRRALGRQRAEEMQQRRMIEVFKAGADRFLVCLFEPGPQYVLEEKR